MKTHSFLFTLFFLFTITVLLAQSESGEAVQDIDDFLLSPMMMLGREERVDPERTSSGSRDATRRGSDENNRSTISQEDEVSADIRDHIRRTEALHVAIETRQEMMEAQERLAEVERGSAVFQNRLQQEEYTGNKASVLALRDAALMAEENADTSYNQALNAPLASQRDLYEQAIQRRHAAVAIWEQAIISAESIFSALPENNSELRTEWNTQIENLKNAKKKASVTALWDAALKTVSIADMMECQASTVSLAELPNSYEKMIQQAFEVKEAWEQVITALEEGWSTIFGDQEDAELWWRTGIETTTDAKNSALARILFYKAKQKSILAKASYNHARGAFSTEQLTYLELAIEQEREATRSWEEAARFSNTSLSFLPATRDDLQQAWKTKIEEAKNIKNGSSIAALIYDATRAGCLAAKACHQALTIPHSQSLHDEAVQKMDQEANLWRGIMRSLEQGLSTLPLDRDGLRTCWIEDRAEAANNINRSAAQQLLFNAEKIDMAARETFFLVRAPINAQAAAAWSEVIQFSQESLSVVPMHRGDLRSWWVQTLEYAQERRR